ncbi:3'-5' exonuclease, partial [candidate division WOR-3 bacterium]|nr:3'-5' exonuclease [candidate division WOR-3 bacterium]
MKKIDDFSTFVSFDLETTGLSDTDKIIEFGAVRVEKYEIKETYQTLINPRTHIPIDVFILTGIKRDEVMDAPNIQDVKDTIIDFIGEFPLVAHNAPFDISFLKREISEILNPV